MGRSEQNSSDFIDSDFQNKEPRSPSAAPMKLHCFNPFAALLLLTALTRAGDEKFPLWDGKETAAEYAKRSQLEPTLTLDVGGGVKWEGMLIPAGAFVMGSPAGEAKTEKESAMEKQHKVTITQPFYMGKY